MTYYTAANGTSYLWLAGGTIVGAGETIAMTTDFAHVTPRVLKSAVTRSHRSLLPNHPGSAAPDADYAGPGSVFRASNGRDLLMIYHGENHTFNGVETNDEFYATICVARSHDNGLTWQREGAIISGMQPQASGTPPRPAMGAGNPSAIVAGGYIYVFYVNLGYDTGPDQTHVARASVSSDAAPGTWKKWYGGTFSQPGLGGTSTPVMALAGAGGKDLVWAANGIVSYNTYLRAYLKRLSDGDRLLLRDLAGFAALADSRPTICIRSQRRCSEARPALVFVSVVFLARRCERSNDRANGIPLLRESALGDRTAHDVSPPAGVQIEASNRSNGRRLA